MSTTCIIAKSNKCSSNIKGKKFFDRHFPSVKLSNMIYFCFLQILIFLLVTKISISTQIPQVGNTNGPYRNDEHEVSSEELISLTWPGAVIGGKLTPQPGKLYNMS